MGRFLTTFLITGAFLHSGIAQSQSTKSTEISSIKENGAFQADRVTSPSGQVGKLPAKQWREIIENHGASPITALHATFRCRSALNVAQYDLTPLHDSLENYGHDFPIPPSGSIEISAADPSVCPGGVDAVIFADGRSEGDPRQVKDIYLARRGIYEELDEIIAQFSSIAMQGEAPQQALDVIEKRSKSLSVQNNSDIGNLAGFGLYAGPEPRDPSEFLGRMWALSVAELRLKYQSNWQTPSDFTANRQPSIEKVMETEHVPRTQAQAIIVGKKLQEWKADLQGNTEPPKGQ